MYAIVQIGSGQYKVTEGETIAVSKVAAEEGKSITFDQVLAVGDDKDITFGQPFVAGAKVSAKVIKQALGEKVVAFKYRIRKDSAQKIGHRKKLTELSITKITTK